MDVRGKTSTEGWWFTFVRGLVALCLGGALLLAGAGQSRLATFIGSYWLLGAVLTIRWVLRSREAPGRRLGALAAGIGAASALALLARSLINDVVGTAVLLDLVGAGAIATGAMRMLGGFRDDQLADERPRWRDSMLLGGLVGGTLLLVEALRLRRSARTSADASGRGELQLS